MVRVHFKDDATAFNGVKKEILTGKGELNCKISTFFMKLLASKNIPVHFIESITNRDQICYKLDIIPIEVVVRNFAAGSICRRYGIEKGLFFDDPLCELFYTRFYEQACDHMIWPSAQKRGHPQYTYLLSHLQVFLAFIRNC